MDFVRAPIQAPPPLPVLRPHRRLLLLFYLARLPNLALLAATALLALYLLHQTQPLLPIHEVRAFYLITSALLIMAGGYWLNDLYDVEIDTINRPRRAAAVRLLTRRRLLTAVTIAWGAALLCTIPLRWQFKALHLLVIGALFWYNRWGKRLGLPGNLLVAGLTALLPWELMLLTGRTAYAVDWMIPLAAVFNFAPGSRQRCRRPARRPASRRALLSYAALASCLAPHPPLRLAQPPRLPLPTRPHQIPPLADHPHRISHCRYPRLCAAPPVGTH
jgi:hypothetical protein